MKERDDVTVVVDDSNNSAKKRENLICYNVLYSQQERSSVCSQDSFPICRPGGELLRMILEKVTKPSLEGWAQDTINNMMHGQVKASRIGREVDT